jgi:hypothetical protein
MAYYAKPDPHGNYSGRTIEDAFNEVGKRIRALEDLESDMAVKLMDMQKRLIDQLTAEIERLKKERENGG